MTEPSKEAIERACEMMSCSTAQSHLHPVMPVARFIQEVSDVARQGLDGLAFVDGRKLRGEFTKEVIAARDALKALILPDPEPDVVEELWHLANKSKDHFRSAIAEGGYEIRKVSE